MLTPWLSQIYATQIISGQFMLHHLDIPAQQQTALAASMQNANGILLTEWVAPYHENNTPITAWYVLYLMPMQGLWCARSLLQHTPALHDLSLYFPVANRLQRTIYELTHISTQQMSDNRPWLKHDHDPYPFQQVSGDGVHEIPVGPVHAGIIEPGHFRFSVVGERILKLEEHLGYTHKGIHQLCLNKSIKEVAQLMARVSGDSTVGYSYAFAMACEQALEVETNETNNLHRAILLERERLANHIGDLGAIINDTSLPSLQSPFSLLKENLLRHNMLYSGHRYCMDVIIPLHSLENWTTAQLATMADELTAVTAQLTELKNICDNHHGLQDRIVGTGILSHKIAKKLGVVGITAKASGINIDVRDPRARCDHLTTGDVAARVSVRFAECVESISLIQQYLIKLQQQTHNNGL